MITKLIKILNEKQWQYAVSNEGKFSMILGNEELSCHVQDDEKIQKIIEEVLAW